MAGLCPGHFFWLGFFEVSFFDEKQVDTRVGFFTVSDHRETVELWLALFKFSHE